MFGAERPEGMRFRGFRQFTDRAYTVFYSVYSPENTCFQCFRSLNKSETQVRQHCIRWRFSPVVGLPPVRGGGAVRRSSRASGIRVAPAETRALGQSRPMCNQERELGSGPDWRELFVSLLVAAAVGMFTVYGLVHFIGAMMCGDPRG